MDTVPFSWQIKDIRHEGFELVSRKATSDQGMLFTWKKRHLKKGETAKIEYVVVKRIQRSIVTKQENKFSLVNTYHSLSGFDTGNLTAKIEFVNTSGKIIEHLLIEDLIPPEFTIREMQSGNHRPIKLPTKDSVIYRWVIENLPPGDSLVAEYFLAAKPLPRWYRRRLTHWAGGELVLEKFVQPMIDVEGNEYLVYLDIKAGFATTMQVMDQVPLGSATTFYFPLWLRPETLSREDARFLCWQLHLDAGERVQILLRLKTDKPYNPPEPVVRIEGIKSWEKREKIIKHIAEKIDLKEKFDMLH